MIFLVKIQIIQQIFYLIKFFGCNRCVIFCGFVTLMLLILCI